jgi:hypothetical protein
MLYKFQAYYNFRKNKLEIKLIYKNIADGNKMLKKYLAIRFRWKSYL